MIKVYDSSLEKYVTIASNRGDNLYTKSINFNSPELPNYDNDASIITIDEALTSISEEIKEVKEGVAWVYKNGTIGGGGGSGSGMPKFKVTSTNGNISNDAIIVNNNQTLNLSFVITGSNNGRKMNITIKDDKGNYYGYNNSTYTVSSKSTNIQIPNIKENLIIEFTGYDQETLSVIEPYTLHIRVSSLKITAPESIQISKSDTEYNITYNVSTTYGQNTYIILSTTIDSSTYNYVSEQFISDRQITLNVFDIFTEAGFNLEDALKRENSIDSMEIIAKAVAGDYSDTTMTSIVFTSENKISVDIIPLSNIIGEAPSYVYTENDNISFNIKLYFNTNEYYMYYKLYQLIDENEIIVYEKGDILNPTSSLNKISSTQFYSKDNPITIPYPMNIESDKPVYVYVKAWDKTNQTFEGEKTKWFGIRSDETWKPYNLSLSGLDEHIDGGLNYLYYEYNSINFEKNEINNKIISTRNYKGSSTSNTLINGYIEYYNANNITNGVLLRGKSNEIVNTFRMSSNSYGIFYDNDGNKFKPFDLNNNWMKNPEGWTISLSYKADKQSNTDSVIFSCASFDNLGNFSEGIHITTTDVNVKFTNSTKQINKWNLSAKISQNVHNQIDIVYKPRTIETNNTSKKIGELKIFINGVLAAAGIETNIDFDKNNYYPTILSDTVVGCSHNGKIYSNFADVNFYRILFYKRALTPYHITKNLIQGHADIEVLADGNIDRIANNEMRAKNFFTDDGKCLIIDDTTYLNDCEYVKNLYSTLSTSESNPLPVVMIKVPKEFKSVTDGRYTESQVADDKKLDPPVITREYDAVITIMKEKSNKQFIMGRSGGDNKIGDNSGKDCTIKLQGTSTLGNKSKNFEISFGASIQEDNTPKENLVQVFEDMLPENSWILKADVMDSGHANNAAIGGFINDFLSSYKTIANTNSNNNYASEIKTTTEGHPVILFMQFGDNGNQEFLGIYSFNLGRISYYNLGYQVFDGYYKVISSINDEEKEVVYKDHKVENTSIEFPALVSSYKTIPVPYTNNLTGVDSNSTTAVCYECNGNNNIVGSFQQSDANVINEFYYRVYPNIDNTNSTEADKRFRKLFIATSNLYECDPEYLCKMEEGDEYLKTRSLLKRNSKGEFLNKETNAYEIFNKNSYDNGKYIAQDSWAPTDSYFSLVTSQTNENDNHVGLNWEFASAYFTLASLFGLTDSLGKNLNIRSFNLADWYVSFYDMDTGLGLTNAGYETVKPDVYLDKFLLNPNQQETDVKINGYKEGGFDTINSRLFNIIRFFTNKNYPNTGTKPTTNYRKIWEDIRKGLLKDPNNFIDDYYIKQNKNVGEIIFNYDYDVKYINDEIDMITNPNSNINIGSINFLHGNRVNFVRDWFSTHVFFLDGVFDIKCQAPLTNETKELYGNAAGTGYYGLNTNGNIVSDSNFNESAEGVICPYITFSNQSNRINPSFDGYKPFVLKSNIPMFFIYNNGTLNQRLFIDKNVLTDVKLYFKSGNEQTMTFNNAPYISIFDKFGTLSYVTMQPNLSSLTELDLSNTTVLSGAQDSFDISRLIELRKLNMNNVKTTSGNSIPVNLQNAYKISYIDLRDANVNSLTLPGYGDAPGGSLEEIYIDNTIIQNIDLTGHAMLKKFSAKNCKNLTSLIFKYNELLEDVGNIPDSICGNSNPNLNGLVFDECNSLKKLNLTGMKYLSNDNFTLGHLENLEEFSYSYTNVKDGAYLTEIDLSGCPNLKKLNLQSFNGNCITLNKKSQETLESIDITGSKIAYINWIDTENDNTIYRAMIKDTNCKNVLDFSNCTKLNSIKVQNNKAIEYILLHDKANINEFVVLSCDNLKRITGNIGAISVNQFKNLSSFHFNELCKYDEDDTTSNIIIDENGDVKFYENVIDPTLSDEIDSVYYTNYELRNLLTHYSFKNDNAELDNAFENTGINISDLYAILIKLKSWKSEKYISDDNENGFITEFNSTFKNCKNIKTRQIVYEKNITGYIININPLSDYLIEQKNIKYTELFNGFNNLKILKNTFEGCSNINGHLSFGENSIFKPIEKLSIIENVFNDCGKLFINENIFNNNKNLTMISQPFSTLTEYLLYNSEYPVIGEISNSQNKLPLKNLFYGLINLETLNDVFFNTQVKYKFDEIKDIFKTNISLSTIKHILPNNYTGTLILSDQVNSINLANIFGGCYRAVKNGEYDNPALLEELNKIDDFDNLYPRHLKNLDYAFATDGSNTEQPMLDWDNMNYIFYNLKSYKNELTEKYEVELESCKYMFDKLAYIKNGDADNYYNYSTNIDESLAKFPINMFTIKHKDENGNKHDVYFSNLSNIEGLFMRAAFKDELIFPGNIFKYCTAPNINLSHLLEDTVMTPIKLVNINDEDENGNKYACFSNCNLKNVSSMFKNCFKGIDKNVYYNEDGAIDMDYYSRTGYKFDRGGLHGLIPNKFFFNNSNNITNMESVFEGCCHLGTNINLICDVSGNYQLDSDSNGDFIARDSSCFYTIRKPDLETLHSIVNTKEYKKLLDLVEVDDNGLYHWNEYGYDGTQFSDEYLDALNAIKLDGDNRTYTDAKHENISEYVLVADSNNICFDASGNYKLNENTSINDISTLLSGNMLTSLMNDKCFIKIENKGDIIDGTKYIRVYYDADYDIKNVNYNESLINNDQLWHCNDTTYILKSLDGQLDTANMNKSYKNEKNADAWYATKFISNYAYPMDLFKYCSSTCNINYALKGISRFNNDDKRKNYYEYVYGIIGRIPPKLFDTLTKTTEMKGVFEDNRGFVPYAQSLSGEFYSNMFNKNESVQNIDYMFKETMLLGHLSEQLFKNNKNLSSVSELFKNSFMPQEYSVNALGESFDYKNFVNNNDIFNNNSELSNISGMFSNDANKNSYNSKDAKLYFNINSNLFTTKNNGKITNASSVFAEQTGVQRNNEDMGTFINFMEWPYIGTNYSNCYKGANFNLKEIPVELGGNQEK